jgi:hypothetical protein
MIQITEAVDALGNPIEFGKRYGYSTSSSGRSRTVVGIASKITPTGSVTLTDVQVKNYIYGDPYDRTWAKDAKKVTIRPHMVFPVVT